MTEDIILWTHQFGVSIPFDSTADQVVLSVGEDRLIAGGEECVLWPHVCGELLVVVEAEGADPGGETREREIVSVALRSSGEAVNRVARSGKRMEWSLKVNASEAPLSKDQWLTIGSLQEAIAGADLGEPWDPYYGR